MATKSSTFTTVGTAGSPYLILPVAIVEDDSTTSSDDAGRWCAHVCDPAHPFAGLYAFDVTLEAARQAIAETAWAAILAGEAAELLPTTDALAGVYVVSTTCDVYDAQTLAAAAAGDVPVAGER